MMQGIKNPKSMREMKENKELYFEIFNQLDFARIIDHPNILIAANFWEEERYRAAKVCYKFMREIDDFIDNYKSENIQIEQQDKQLFIEKVNTWIGSLQHNEDNGILDRELLLTFSTYKIPYWTMENFARAMIYDINHNGFSSLNSFLEYSRGASIAPASVFVHLCGIRKSTSGFLPPEYDVKRAATPCAIFSYLVHIIRDFQKDQLNNLNYFADDKILKYGLKHSDLSEMAKGSQIKQGFRDMINEYYSHAEIYKNKTRDMIQEISPLLEPRYQLSLEIIFNLYLMVFERIDIEKGKFTKEELNPTCDEIKERVRTTIIGFQEV